MILDTDMLLQNNSERPVDALAEKGESLTHSLTDNLKSRDASASKNMKCKCLRRRGINFISSCPSVISPKTGTKNQAFRYHEIGQTAFDYIFHFHFYL